MWARLEVDDVTDWFGSSVTLDDLADLVASGRVTTVV